jgi:hypothetical protein
MTIEELRYPLYNEPVLEYTTTEYIPKVNEMIKWINDHEANTLPRFEQELIELIKTSEPLRSEIKLMFCDPTKNSDYASPEYVKKETEKYLAEKELEEAIENVVFAYPIDQDLISPTPPRGYNFTPNVVRKLKCAYLNWRRKNEFN